MRELTYREALSEGLTQAMEADDTVFVMGVGADDPKGIFGTTLEAHRRFGSERVFDIPLSENALTGVAIGASLSGMRPVMVHARNDFMLLTMDQLVNNASKWRYTGGGGPAVPITIVGIVGRGWGQGSQHSQSLQATFCHFPGLKVVMPATPHDAKGLLIASLRDDGPVVFIEHRQLFERAGPVPAAAYEVPLGEAAVLRQGTDVTIVAMSLMVFEALRAGELLGERGISAEIIDLRTLSPMDDETVFESVRRTHRLIVADTAWRTCGIGSEITARVAENVFGHLEAPVRRIASPDAPAPASSVLEGLFYPGTDDIVDAAIEIVRGRSAVSAARGNCTTGRMDEVFRGPF